MFDVIRDHAQRLSSRISEAEWSRIGSLSTPWRASKFEAAHRADVRGEIHREALVALAGVLERGPNAPGHMSDWLKSLSHLYFDLSAEYLDTVRDSYIATLSSELRDLGASGDIDAFAREVGALLAELDAAKDFLDAIWNHDAKPFSPEWFEHDAKFRYGTILTSFNREDVFNFLGDQTVRWLRDRDLVRPTHRALEIGCGSGRILKPLSPHVATLHGVDRSERMLELARAHCEGRGNITFVHNDGRSLPVAEGRFDLVYSFIVFSYIPDLDVRLALIREAHRVLAPGGRLVISHNDVSADLEAFASSIGFVVEASDLDDDRWALGSLRRGPQWVGQFRR